MPRFDEDSSSEVSIHPRSVFCYENCAVRVQLAPDDDAIRTAVLQSSNVEHPIGKVIEFDDVDLVKTMILSTLNT